MGKEFSQPYVSLPWQKQQNGMRKGTSGSEFTGVKSVNATLIWFDQPERRQHTALNISACFSQFRKEPMLEHVQGSS